MAGSVSGLALAAVGCNEGTKTTALPGISWPDVAAHPTPRSGRVTPSADPPATVISTGPGVLQRVYRRSNWTRTGPDLSRIRSMGRIERITIHHEGMDEAVQFDDIANMKQRLRKMHRSHVNRGFADLGYHYVIDRAGRIWQGRSLDYQGAHVKNHNPHNIGVMVLGDFELQSPTPAQVAVLSAAVRELRDRYRVPLSGVHTHQELGPTLCPGTHLQVRVTSL